MQALIFFSGHFCWLVIDFRIPYRVNGGNKMKRKCPACGSKVKYLELDDLYECVNCGETMTDYESTHGFDNDDSGCAACGNPDYPNCKDSCSMFDD